jgi:hypothetical protein
MQSGEHLWPAALLPGFQPMTDKTDQSGKGPYRPSDPPKRPYATIDAQATVIGGERGQSGAAPRPDSGSEPRGGALPPAVKDRLAAAWAAFTSALATAWSLGLRLARNSSFLSHAAAGVAGAALTLAVGGLLGLLGAGQGGERAASNLAMRLAAVEKAQQRPALPADAAAKLAGTETRLAKLEERVDAANARLAADAKAIEARLPSVDVSDRIAKLEAELAALTAADKTGSARGAADQDVARLKSEAQSLRQSVDALKGSVEDQLKNAAKAGDFAPVMARLAGVERDMQGVLKTEGARVAGAHQVLLALEVSSLKRALDRGDSYAQELDAVRRTAAGSIDLAPLERDSRTGVPTLGALTEELRRTANAAIDAEHERPDASVLDRLMSGARSIVRWRKASYDADDTSAEAILARVESALRGGRLGEALAQGRRLPPKAAHAAEGWLRKLEARTAADRAIANIEAALKASLSGAGPPPPPEATR